MTVFNLLPMSEIYGSNIMTSLRLLAFQFSRPILGENLIDYVIFTGYNMLEKNKSTPLGSLSFLPSTILITYRDR